MWTKKYPDQYVIPYAIGTALSGHESPDATEFLLRAVRLNPKLDEAWYDLSIGAMQAGDKKLVNVYMGKAAQLDSLNTRYAFEYAFSFQDLDTAVYHSRALDLLKKFPNDEIGAKALYWLASGEQQLDKKIDYYELLKNNFTHTKSSWYTSGMQEYFFLIMTRDPKKALEIAKIDRVPGHLKLADTLLKVNELLNQQKAEEAYTFIQPIVLARDNGRESFLLLKARVADAANHTSAAYDTITRYYSRKPSDSLRAAMYLYASKLGLSPLIVQNEVKRLRDSVARPATGFTLYNYQTKTNCSLSDFKGKVILLTYWFPGCGPCRAEMPFFEDVIKTFDKKDVVYLGLNVVPEQDALVLPFLKSTGYSFIPLRDSWTRKGGNLQVIGAPTNFIIDQDGRVVFSDFRILEHNEDMLRLMIGDLVESNKKRNVLADTVVSH